MTDIEPIFIDTSILVHAFEKEATRKKKKAEKILKQCWRGEIILAVSSQTSTEFSCVMLKKGKLKIDEVKEVLNKIVLFQGFLKLSYSSQTIFSVLRLLKKTSTSFWDALIAATMLENNISHIYTENTKDFAFEGIVAINPFEKK